MNEPAKMNLYNSLINGHWFWPIIIVLSVLVAHSIISSQPTSPTDSVVGKYIGYIAGFIILPAILSSIPFIIAVLLKRKPRFRYYFFAFWVFVLYSSLSQTTERSTSADSAEAIINELEATVIRR